MILSRQCSALLLCTVCVATTGQAQWEAASSYYLASSHANRTNGPCPTYKVRPLRLLLCVCPLDLPCSAHRSAGRQVEGSETVPQTKRECKADHRCTHDATTGCQLNPGIEGFAEGVRLTDATIAPQNARCLDGSAPMYYIKRGECPHVLLGLLGVRSSTISAVLWPRKRERTKQVVRAPRGGRVVRRAGRLCAAGRGQHARCGRCQSFPQSWVDRRQYGHHDTGRRCARLRWAC